MKKISVLIPCYNEEENVVPMSEAVADIFAKELPEYDYELVFIDNDSKDATRPLFFEADSRSRFLFSEAPGFSFLSAWKIIRNFTRFIIHRCGREPRFYSSWKKTTSKYSVRGCITCKTSIWKFLAGNWSSFRTPARL